MVFIIIFNNLRGIIFLYFLSAFSKVGDQIKGPGIKFEM